MELAWNILILLAGFFCLWAGAESLVRGASKLARSLGVSALAVGLTVVALGTSLPELVVSLIATYKGAPDLAVGNIVGSNICNILLILGVSALICPLACQPGFIRRTTPFMILVSGFLWLLCLDGDLDRHEGILFLLLLAAYNYTLFRTEKKSLVPAEERTLDEGEVERPRWLLVLMILAGGGGLVIGSNFIVDGATFLARRAGVSDLVIGLSMVALGTSLPELATCVVAAARKETELVVGNCVGSNIYNILMVLGVASVITPLPISPSVLRFDLPIMTGAAALSLPFMITGRTISRKEGALLLSGYLSYVAFLFLEAGARLAVPAG